MTTLVSMWTLLSISSLFVAAQEKNELVATENTSNARVRKALKNSHRIFLKGPSENCDQVINGAELLLFKVYGRKRILNVNPIIVLQTRYGGIYMEICRPVRSKEFSKS